MATGPLMRVSVVASFTMGTWQFLVGNISLGDLLAAYFAVLVGVTGLGTLTSGIETVNLAMLTFEKVLDMIIESDNSEINALDDDTGEKLSSKSMKGEIIFENVSFKYPNQDRYMIHKLNLTIKAGETVALVGPSGSGKSTILKLINRFYDPENNGGSIKIDGKNIKNINVKSLRSIIGFVKQEPELFAGTILENVNFAMSEVNLQHIQSALHKANAREFTKSFSDGLNTFLGSKGDQLSGGQKQRLAIARTLIRKNRILLLDEATSALDGNSEKLIQNHLKNMDDLTTVIVAHRLSSIEHVDRIIVIDQGKKVEEGSHRELYGKQDGVYRRLVDAQRNDFMNMVQPDQNTITNLSQAAPNTRVKNMEKSPLYGSNNNNESESRILKLSRVFSEIIGIDTKDDDATLGSESNESNQNITIQDVLPFAKDTYFKIFLACFSAAANGALEIIPFMIISNMIKAYTDENNDGYSDVWKEIWINNGILLGLAVLSFFGRYFKNWYGQGTGQILIRRFRYLYLKHVLEQDISLFDSPEYPTNYFLQRLSSDCEQLDSLLGNGLTYYFEALGAVLAAIIIAFIYDWRLALLSMGFMPFIILGTSFEISESLQVEGKVANQDNLTGKKGNLNKIYRIDRELIAEESLSKILTVMALNCQEKVISRFEKYSNQEYKKMMKTTLIRSFFFGASDMMIYFMFAGCFRYGLELLRDLDDAESENEKTNKNHLEFYQIFTIIMSTLNASISSGRSLIFAPDNGKVAPALNRIFHMLRRQSGIESKDTPPNSNSVPLSPVPEIKGTIEFKNVHYSYPTRPNTKILNGLSFKTSPNQIIALVGHSGCGKSTIIQLLERFYDPDDGKIIIDGVNVEDYDVTGGAAINSTARKPIVVH